MLRIQLVAVACLCVMMTGCGDAPPPKITPEMEAQQKQADQAVESGERNLQKEQSKPTKPSTEKKDSAEKKETPSK